MSDYARTRNAEGREYVHRVRAERALGKPLPDGAEVHHLDGTKNADAPLVICQDVAYHRLLHMRERLLRRGGNPNTEKWCSDCRAPRPKSEFNRNRASLADGLHHVCRGCASARNKTYLPRANEHRRRRLAVQAAAPPPESGASA